MTEGVKGYKCFDQDLKCLGFQFEVGKTYEVSGKLEMCKHGFHFHENPTQLFNYYPNNSGQTRVCEVLASDVLTAEDKSVCRSILVVRELTHFEICNLIGGDGYGDGYGKGYGNCNGKGYGSGYGSGYGYGDGYGNCNGDGYGDGYGDGNYQFPNFIEFIQEKAA